MDIFWSGIYRIHTNPYHASGGIWWTERLEGDIFGKWVFPLKKITQPHARVLAIPNKLITKAKMLLIADITAPWEWRNTVNALCSLECSLALMWNRRGWTMCSQEPTPWPHSCGLTKGDPRYWEEEKHREEGMSCLGSSCSHSDCSGYNPLGSSAEVPKEQSICYDPFPRAFRTHRAESLLLREEALGSPFPGSGGRGPGAPRRRPPAAPPSARSRRVPGQRRHPSARGREATGRTEKQLLAAHLRTPEQREV